MSIIDTRIKDVVAKPYGPYREALVLEPKCNTRRKHMVLRSLCMTCGDGPIGFDETEFTGSNPKSRINNKDTPVRFRGVVEIEHLDWLTRKARFYLERDIRERDLDIHAQTRHNPTSDLTLDKIYRRDPVFKGKGHTIKVEIDGLKGISALYLRDQLPDGLLFHTKDLTNNYRSYEVKSLDIDTQIRSENFFLRYRLLSLIEAIIASDPKTGPEDRTIDYFINQYISKFAAGYSRIREHQRLIYDSDDSDVDSDGNTKKKRHLRTVHRADVRGIFASQAEWILKDQLERKGRYLLNISKWTQFCKEVKINRRDARENGRRWGLPRGHEIVADDSDSEIDFKLAGSFSEGALTRLKRILKRVNEKPSKSRSKSKSKGKGKQRAAVPVVSSESEDMQDPDEEPYVLPQHVYDSDFSVPSTPSASSSSDDDSEVENPEIYKLLPQPFWHPPKPPGLDFRWCCPAAGCMYVIDMLNLTDENVRGLHVDEAAFLRAKMWERLHSDRVSKNFLRMVSNHYDQHMLEVGVVWKNFCTTAAELVWENPKRHALWPPKHKKKLVQHAEEIKEEEVDETHLPSSSHAGSSRTLRSNITRLSFET